MAGSASRMEGLAITAGPSVSPAVGLWRRVLTEVDPLFPDWDQDRTAVEDL